MAVARWAGAGECAGGSLPGQLPRVTLTEQAGVAFPGPQDCFGAAADPRGPAEAPCDPMAGGTRVHHESAYPLRWKGECLSFTVLGYNCVK